jgi:hypothetical protein
VVEDRIVDLVQPGCKRLGHINKDRLTHDTLDPHGNAAALADRRDDHRDRRRRRVHHTRAPIADSNFRQSRTIDLEVRSFYSQSATFGSQCWTNGRETRAETHAGGRKRYPEDLYTNTQSEYANVSHAVFKP